ncbi:hypothetical protein UC34_00545 [Pandoraea vervacti]|uniref:EamA domain-containing protein n=1 Tax=Pandoraea vervacti TaxID=656178 RepID=A0ABN4FSY5_9BURK|nr:EamA family transporter [Pandoraea vervacti]AJP55886.1 hypothetical protein UC34_00545 [Pandoraea vervacti]
MGILLALAGGCGYALFIFLSKWFRIGARFPQLVWLFGIASGQASTVQIIETSDPLFATLFGFWIFGDTLNLSGTLGAAFIAIGLIVAVWRRRAGAT